MSVVTVIIKIQTHDPWIMSRAQTNLRNKQLYKFAVSIEILQCFHSLVGTAAMLLHARLHFRVWDQCVSHFRLLSDY